MLQGDLSRSSLPDVLKQLAQRSATGRLEVVDPVGAGAELHLDGGAVYAARVAGRRARLGARLVSSGALAPEDLAAALAAQPGSEQRLGELLVARGAVAQHLVEAFLHEQILDAVGDLSGWRAGSWRFTPDARTREDVAPALPVPTLLAAAAARGASWQHIRVVLDGPDAVPSLVGGTAAAGVALDPDAWALLGRVDGVRTVADLARACGFTLYEAGRAVRELVDAGLLALADATAVQAERAEAERVAQVEAERVEAAQVEAERVEAERVEVEAERVEVERAEAEVAAQVEAAQVEAAQVEAERVEAERVEVERVAQVEAERVEAERAEAEVAAQVEAEHAARVAAQVEAHRVEAERAAHVAAEHAARAGADEWASAEALTVPDDLAALGDPAALDDPGARPSPDDPASTAAAFAELRATASSPVAAGPEAPPVAEPGPPSTWSHGPLPGPSDDTDTASLLRELASLGLGDEEPAATAPRTTGLPTVAAKKRKGLFGR